MTEDTSRYLFLLSNFFLWFGHDLLLLGEDHLDVARGAHVGVDPPVRSVGAAAHFGSLVHLDVLDHQRIHVKTLGWEGKIQKPVIFLLESIASTAEILITTSSRH